MTGKQVIQITEKLQSLRSPHEWLWNEIGFLTNAKYLNRNGNVNTGGVIPHTEIYDTTLRTKSRMQANGITSMLFPRDRDWLQLTPPWKLRNQESAKRAFRDVGDGLMHHLRESNFHHQNHGVITHRSQLGTGTMLMEWIKDDFGRDKMNFRRFEPMTYLIDHDAETRVQTFAAEYQWSASTAAEKWGMDNLSPKLQAEARLPANRDQLRDFIMLIEKRPSWERDQDKGNKGMLYSVTVVEKEGEHVVVDSGNEIFQIVASRYEVFDSPWGYSPAWEILPDAYKANYAAKFMMVMGERAAVPPVIAPASMKEEGIGLGAAEVTYVSDLNPDSWPRELASRGDYKVGMEIWNLLRSSIDEAFHGNLFNMFSRQTRERTATEINAMQGELNAQIDPTITALTQDHTAPVVAWSFVSLVEKGKIDFPEEYWNQETGRPEMPTFGYDNSISMNHNRAKALDAMGLIDQIANLQGAGLDVDVVNLQKAQRRIWRDHGLDEDDLYSEEESAQRDEEKEKAAQQAQMMEAAPGIARAAKDASDAGIELPG